MTTWKTVELGEIAHLDRSSIKPEEIGPGTTYLGLEDIQKGGEIINTQTVENGELKSSKFRFGPNHLLYGKLRPYLGKIAAPDFQGICSTDIIPLLPKQGVYRQYLLYFLRQKKVVEYAASRSSGANLPRISPKQLAKLKIALPPLAEQKRIAEILGKADALRAKRREALAQLDSLLQSTFIDMFGDPVSNPLGWDEAKIRSVTTSCQTWNPRFKPTVEFHYIDLSSIDKSSKRIANHESFLGSEAPSRARQLVASGDILVSTVRPNLNGVAQVTEPFGGMTASTGFSVLRPNPTHITSAYLFSWVKTPLFVEKMLSVSTGANYPAVSDKKVRDSLILLPPLDLQRRFATIVESVEQQKARMHVHLDELDALFASLQHRAFNGEL